MQKDFFKIELFTEIVGHTTMLDYLRKILHKNILPHGLLFSGPSGIGKRSLAKSLATILLSKEPLHPFAKTSSLVEAGNHPDLHYINAEEGKKDISVDSIRQLISTLHLKPYLAKCSVVIIDNAHQMNLAASNALLMTLEEPSNNCHLILITEAAHRLPETIVSRCQVFHFGLLNDTEITKLIDKLFGAIIEDKQALALLKTICPGSLSPLQIDSFINNKTLKFDDLAAVKSHLEQLIAEIQKFQRKLEPLIKRTSSSHTLALSLAADFASNQQINPLFWQTLRTSLHSCMRNTEINLTSHYADLLLETIKTQQSIAERNLNAQLQVSSLMLKAI